MQKRHQSFIFVFNATISKGPVFLCLLNITHADNECECRWQILYKVKCILRVFLVFYWGFFSLLRQKLLPALEMWSHCLDRDPQVSWIIDMYLKCQWGLSVLIHPFSDKHALGSSIQDSMMLFNWQFKICSMQCLYS